MHCRNEWDSRAGRQLGGGVGTKHLPLHVHFRQRRLVQRAADSVVPHARAVAARAGDDVQRVELRHLLEANKEQVWPCPLLGTACAWRPFVPCTDYCQPKAAHRCTSQEKLAVYRSVTHKWILNCRHAAGECRACAIAKKQCIESVAERYSAVGRNCRSTPGCVSHARRSWCAWGVLPLTLNVLAHTRNSVVPTKVSDSRLAKCA
jgi:hypothetical protein